MADTEKKTGPTRMEKRLQRLPEVRLAITPIMLEAKLLLEQLPHGSQAELARRLNWSADRVRYVAMGVAPQNCKNIGPSHQQVQLALYELRRMQAEHNQKLSQKAEKALIKKTMKDAGKRRLVHKVQGQDRSSVGITMS